jgi:homoserine O-acetyltransferase/O-succinyltransferase
MNQVAVSAPCTPRHTAEFGHGAGVVDITANGKPFCLSSNAALAKVELAYETWGTLNQAKNNALLLFHAFSGSAHAAGVRTAAPHQDIRDLWNEECAQGWWDGFIGPGKALDTRRYFVICANYLGGCYGSTGPRSVNPLTGESYQAEFPGVGLSDIVDSQRALLAHFGITKLHAVIGPSLGGLLALNLVTRFPEICDRVIPIGSGLQVTAQQQVLNFEQIFAIESDPEFRGGFYDGKRGPARGLALARMIAHKTFVAPETLNGRARHTVEHASPCSWYQFAHPIESYMWHQGNKFTSRFDANTYLRILKMWQDIDLCRDAQVSSFGELLSHCSNKQFLVLSIDRDHCFPRKEQVLLSETLAAEQAQVKHVTVHSDKGHDAFLVQPELFEAQIADFLNR